MSPPLPYIQRIRDYYQALGYGKSYEWAAFEDVPFAKLKKPISRSRLAIVTTAAPYQPDKGDQGPGAPYNGSAKFFSVYSKPTDIEPDLRISHIAIDRSHTTAEDQNSYFPLKAFRILQKDGHLGELSPRFHGLPTNRSQRTTSEVDSVELLRRCRADSTDLAVLVPNCPVCHQSVALTARVLEDAGIATVILGCAKDIVEHVGVPRFLFNDLPLGNSAGLPNDPDAQLTIARMALDLFENAKEARTTVQSPVAWPESPQWKKDYSNAALLSAEEIAEKRAEFDRGKQAAAKVRGDD